MVDSSIRQQDHRVHSNHLENTGSFSDHIKGRSVS